MSESTAPFPDPSSTDSQVRTTRHAGGHRRRVATALLVAALMWPAGAAQAGTDVAPAGDVPAATAATAASLSGRVTDSTGAPLAGVQVLVGDAVPGDPLPETAADGTWTIDGLAAGSYHVQFLLRGSTQPYPVYWDGTTYGTYLTTGRHVTLTDGEARGGIDVTYIDNTVVGSVTANGGPVAGARVELYRFTSPARPVQSVVTDPTGAWTARWLRPDSYLVRVVPPAGSGLAATWWGHTGNVLGSVYFSGSRAQVRQGVVVDLPAEARVAGKVVDLDGRPVARTQVALWSRDNTEVAAGYATTGGDGTYTFPGLDVGTYTVQVAHPSSDLVVPAFLGGSLQLRKAVWTTVGAQAHVTVGDLVQQEGGTVSGRVVLQGPDGVGVRAELVAADGPVVLTMDPSEEKEGDTVLTFSTEIAVPAGSYRVRLLGGGDLPWWAGGNSFDTAQVFEVGAGAPVTDVELVADNEHHQPPAAPAVDELTDEQCGSVTTVARTFAGSLLTVGGLAPGELAYTWLGSTPVGLGYADVADDGTVEVTVPETTTPGSHRLVVTDVVGTVVGWTDLTVRRRS